MAGNPIDYLLIRGRGGSAPRSRLRLAPGEAGLITGARES